MAVIAWSAHERAPATNALRFDSCVKRYQLLGLPGTRELPE